MPGTWKETDRGGVGSATKRYRRAIDTQLGRNRRHQKRSRILMGKAETDTWLAKAGRQADRLRLRDSWRS